jgi:hypothetical protein
MFAFRARCRRQAETTIVGKILPSGIEHHYSVIHFMDVAPFVGPHASIPPRLQVHRTFGNQHGLSANSQEEHVSIDQMTWVRAEDSGRDRARSCLSRSQPPRRWQDLAEDCHFCLTTRCARSATIAVIERSCYDNTHRRITRDRNRRR